MQLASLVPLLLLLPPGRALPLALEDEEDCACSEILVSSLGPAARHQPQAMGVYLTYGGQSYSQRPAYQGPGPVTLYYSQQQEFSCWMVGPGLGALSGYLYNSGYHYNSPCAYQLSEGWKYWSTSEDDWLEDASLAIRCIPPHPAANQTMAAEESLALLVLV
jgi:hypothetical protein